mmetsp:Transcript_79928/g.158868  ORF Transcript_79928/g.158868 Transcript_79928/m.158868 type:complete len:156 (+) Transcript_79928:799-1266(+)
MGAGGSGEASGNERDGDVDATPYKAAVAILSSSSYSIGLLRAVVTPRRPRTFCNSASPCCLRQRLIAPCSDVEPPSGEALLAPRKLHDWAHQHIPAAACPSWRYPHEAMCTVLQYLLSALCAACWLHVGPGQGRGVSQKLYTLQGLRFEAAGEGE